jgi:hypothetical protein
MRVRRIATAFAVICGMAVMPLPAKAQYYAPCSPFPLAWPFCAAGAIVVGAATIATAPLWLLSGAPPYYYRYYGAPYYPAPRYYAPGYAPPPPAYYYAPR